MRVKIISEETAKMLESSFNTWMDSNKNVTIINVKFKVCTSSGSGRIYFIAFITYT